MKRRGYLRDAGVAVLTTAGYVAFRRTCLPADNSPFTANIDIYEVGGDSIGVSPGHVVGDLARRVFDRINKEVRNETQFDISVKSLDERLEGDSIDHVYDLWGDREETYSGEANLYIHPGDLEGESLGLGASGPECFPGSCGNRYSSDTSHSVMINGEKLRGINRAPREVVLKDSRGSGGSIYDPAGQAALVGVHEIFHNLGADHEYAGERRQNITTEEGSITEVTHSLMTPEFDLWSYTAPDIVKWSAAPSYKNAREVFELERDVGLI